MCPPNGVEMVFILTAMSLLMGMLLGWGWGAIVMKAAQAARPAAETQAKLLQLEQLAVQRANQTGTSVAYEAEALVFEGFMLDGRVSAVFLVLGLVFIYLLCRLRMKNPKFLFAQVFGMIITDLWMTYGPLLPDYDGTLPKSIVEPAAIGLGLAFLGSLLLFPQSTSHVALEMTEKIVDGLKRPLKDIIENNPESEAEEQQALASMNATKQGLLGQWGALQPILGFLKLDFSIGRWSDKDILSLEDKLRTAFIGTMNILNFRMSQFTRTLQAQRALEMPPGSASSDPISEDDDEEKEKKSNDKSLLAAEGNPKLDKLNKQRKIALHQITEFSVFIKAINDADALEVRTETLSMLQRDGSEVLQACIEALDSVKECIHDVNSTRAFSRLSKETFDEHAERSKSVLETLRAARTTFIQKTTDDLLEANAELFDANGKIKTLDAHLRNRFRTIIFGMVFEEHVLSVVDGIIPLLERTSTLYQEKTKNRMWFPAGLGHMANWIFKPSAKAPVSADTPYENPDTDFVDQSSVIQQKLGIARGMRRKPRSRLARIIGGAYQSLVSPDSLYALRVVVVSAALSIPAVIPQSASFYYQQRGLWALIMGQTTMLAYMADFTYSAIGRLIGTVVGGVLGLLAWYIGSGDGDGNSYGLAASVGLFLIPILYARLFLHPMYLLPSMMCAATFLLVIGYGFDYGLATVSVSLSYTCLLIVVL